MGVNLYIPFCKLCILDHSAVLCFLVVKSFIAANDDQLQISFIILQTSHFFSSKVGSIPIMFGHRKGGHGPSAEYATAARSSITACPTGVHKGLCLDLSSSPFVSLPLPTVASYGLEQRQYTNENTTICCYFTSQS